ACNSAGWCSTRCIAIMARLCRSTTCTRCSTTSGCPEGLRRELRRPPTRHSRERDCRRSPREQVPPFGQGVRRDLIIRHAEKSPCIPLFSKGESEARATTIHLSTLSFAGTTELRCSGRRLIRTSRQGPYHVSTHGRFLCVRGAGGGTERSRLRIHC